MKTSTLAAAALPLGLFLSMPMTNVKAAELKVLAGGGIAGPLRDLAAQFEKSSGHKVTIVFGTTPELIKIATSGEPFDLGVTPREVFKDAGALAKFTAPQTDIARVGLGVAVKSGTPKPDIGTPEALKATLLKAQSIATVPESAAGAQVLRVFDKLGIADAVKPKIKAHPAPAAMVAAVAKGEAELGMFLANVLSAPGLELLGPFPAELQSEIFYIAAVSGSSKDAAAARAFISFLTSGDSKAVIKAKGMIPAGG